MFSGFSVVLVFWFSVSKMLAPLLSFLFSTDGKASKSINYFTIPYFITVVVIQESVHSMEGAIAPKLTQEKDRAFLRHIGFGP